MTGILFDTSSVGNTISGSTVTTSLSTTMTNNIICLQSVTNGIVSLSSIADTAGLTWHKRTSVASGVKTLELWWAYSAGVLSSDSIVATFSGAPGASRLTCTAWNGVDLTTPFDVNAGVPKKSGTPSANSPSALSISTTNTNAMLLFMSATSTSYGTATYPSGFTGLASDNAFNLFGSKLVSTVQTGVSESLSWTGGTLTDLCIIIDALRQASGAPTGQVFQQWMPQY